MNRFRSITTAVLLTGVLAGGVYAQGGDQPGRRGGRGPGGPGGVGLPLRALNLSDEQRTQIRTITEQHREQLRADIMAVLTAEQQGQLNKLEAERKARQQQRQQRRQQNQQNRQNQN
jgi:Spy/CpxP family protein refolding chaperone